VSINVGIIGTGNMGGAMIKGLCDAGEAYKIFAYDSNLNITEQLSKEYSINIMSSIHDLTTECDVVIMAVKPQYIEEPLKECARALSKSTLFVSVAVGITISYLETVLGNDKKIVRTMPNTPALVREGITVVSFGDNVLPDEKQMAKDIFKCVGNVEELDESLMSEVTALTSSSPAYVCMMIEAMADSAVQSGIARNISYRLAAQAVLGTARMVLETQKHPAELKDMVCSPSGTTIEAVLKLEEKGFRSAIMSAMKACTEKAIEIGRGSHK
jgi:pyrroline-5-carboxylate reductase